MAKRIQMSYLGKFGRFGNQLFQYAFAKSYAEKYNCTLEIPKNWIGRKIFKNINDPPIGDPLPKTKLDIIPWGRKNIDLFGYFCAPDFVKLLTRKKLKEWFEIKDKWMDLFPKNEKYLAAHLRRGDYTTQFSFLYCTVSKKSYLDTISRFKLDKYNVIWVSEKNKKQHPMCDEKNISFLPDFITLLNADVILRANSSFSFWAAVLSNGEVYSPVVEKKTGKHDVEFVRGNYPAMLIDPKGGTPAILGDLFIEEE